MVLSVAAVSLSGRCQTQIGSDIVGPVLDDDTGFDISISADGQRVAIGAPALIGSGGWIGNTRIYQWVDDRWEQLGLAISGDGFRTNSGADIALSGDGTCIVLGAIFNNNGGSGTVRVFELIGSNWVQKGANIEGSEDFSNIGWDVAISHDGNRIVFSETITTSTNEISGHVKIYEWSADQWVKLGNTLTTPSLADSYGQSVTMSSNGTRIAVGAPTRGEQGIGNTGAVYIYEDQNGNFEDIGQILGTALGSLGEGLDMSEDGNRIVASGGFARFMNQNFAGEGMVYEYNGSSWTQVGQTVGGEAGNRLGIKSSISGDGNKIVLSSFSYTGQHTSQGIARVYRLVNDEWVTEVDDILGVDSRDFLGYSVDLNSDGKYLAVGARVNADTPIKPGYGQVWNVEAMSATSHINTVQDISFFPNPVRDYLTVLSDDINHILLTDVAGKSHHFSTSNMTYDVSSLPPGRYILSMTVDKKSISQPVVIVR